MSASYFEKERFVNRVFCYYGSTDDLFVDETLYPQTIEQALYRELRQHGYQRIILYRHQRGAYCLDQKSKDLWHGEKQADGEGQPKQPDIYSLLGMPGLRGSITRQRPARESDALRIGSISPMDMLRTAQRFMADSIQTAVIFPEGEEVLRDFYSIDSGRALNDFFISLSEPRLGQLQNRNAVLFLMDRLGCQIEELLGSDGWDGVRRFFERRTTHHLIGLPGREEVRSMLNYMRLYGEYGDGRLLTDTGQLDEMSGMIAGRIARNAAEWENKHTAEFNRDELNARDLKETIRYFGMFLERGERLDMETCRAVCHKTNEIPAMEQLQALTGMKKAKEKIRQYIMLGRRKASAAKNPHLSRLRMREPVSADEAGTVTLHFLLLGKPGTGKSTIARLVGDILYENGLLESGHTVKTSPGELKGRYIGDSEANTRRAIEQAMGGVLFIDEAYGLANDDKYSSAILELLIQAMEEHRGAFSLIMAGYGDRMEALMSGEHGNVGLRDRFGSNVIEIEDYTSQELAEIFRNMAGKAHCTVSEELDALLPGFFENWYCTENGPEWSNARNARNLLDAMLPRCEDGMLASWMIPEDKSKYVTDQEAAEVVMELEAMVGLDEVHEQIARLELLIQDGENVRPHFLFYGNPGTGKTTVAEKIGRVLKKAGVLGSDKVISVKAGSLIAGYVGQTAAKAEAVFQRALNGVLFIDEAYNLMPDKEYPNDFGGAVIDLLMSYTDPGRHEPVCIICAGYEEQMKQLLSVNDGLESRFSKPIRFRNYSPLELLQILKNKIAKSKYEADEDFYHAALQNFQDNQAQIARRYNARYIDTYFQDARVRYLRRADVQKIPKDAPRILTGEDAPDITLSGC